MSLEFQFLWLLACAALSSALSVYALVRGRPDRAPRVGAPAWGTDHLSLDAARSPGPRVVTDAGRTGPADASTIGRAMIDEWNRSGVHPIRVSHALDPILRISPGLENHALR